ncbi:MAG TPA: Rrf2 family transcriptional regulator, partial [Flexistipes sinusarabici]|nr:Rrf2 family transcriptional regulator [Flexistipes sinusarabici]
MTHFIHREADYAIRIVAYLAGKNEKIKIKEVCERLYLSKPIVIKIVHKLRRCGIIITETGKNGGIKVSPRIVDLTLYDVLVCMGFNSSINICV